jgi:hypothetical protein
MIDFVDNPYMGELLNTLHEEGVLISLICHASVAMVSVKYRVSADGVIFRYQRPQLQRSQADCCVQAWGTARAEFRIPEDSWPEDPVDVLHGRGSEGSGLSSREHDQSERSAGGLRREGESADWQRPAVDRRPGR